MKNSYIVGHIPRKFSLVCCLFLNNVSDRFTCIVTGPRQYTRDLQQGGLEIPCTYIFSGNETEISKV